MMPLPGLPTLWQQGHQLFSRFACISENRSHVLPIASVTMCRLVIREPLRDCFTPFIRKQRLMQARTGMQPCSSGSSCKDLLSKLLRHKACPMQVIVKQHPHDAIGQGKVQTRMDQSRRKGGATKVWTGTDAPFRSPDLDELESTGPWSIGNTGHRMSQRWLEQSTITQ